MKTGQHCFLIFEGHEPAGPSSRFTTSGFRPTRNTGCPAAGPRLRVAASRQAIGDAFLPCSLPAHPSSLLLIFQMPPSLACLESPFRGSGSVRRDPPTSPHSSKPTCEQEMETIAVDGFFEISGSYSAKVPSFGGSAFHHADDLGGRFVGPRMIDAANKFRTLPGRFEEMQPKRCPNRSAALHRDGMAIRTGVA